MLENLSALAIVPKAKAIAARRLTHNDYLELMRKRSVIEVMATLQSHPYFKDSLAGVSQTNLHREQLEQALSKDIFYKYESLMRYAFGDSTFAAYFIRRCEVNELLAKLRLLAMGFRHHYIVQLPGFLLNKTCFSLIRLAQAETARDCLPVVAGTPYYKVLAGVLPTDNAKPDPLVCEHALWTYFYTSVLKTLGTGRGAEETEQLFLMQAEIYNLDLIYRAKAFFPEALPPQSLRKLLLPVYHVLPQRRMMELADAPDFAAFLRLYNASRARDVYGERSGDVRDASDVPAGRQLYRYAQRSLHMSSRPQTVMSALLALADMERSNIVNVIEGVRYGLPPEEIEKFLKY